MDNEIDEKWIEIPRVQKHKNSIVSISNTGKYRRCDGSEGILSLRKMVWHDRKKEHCYRIIAEHFLITVKRPDQKFIDHITHEPTEYNVNNVLNLRWCTHTENMGFEEARKNLSDANLGSKNPYWKGDDVRPSGAYARARKLYKAGKISEEEFQPYIDALREYRRPKSSKTA